MSTSTRRILSVLALAISAGLLFVADGVRYFDRNVVDSSKFADRGTKALEDDAVREELVGEIVKRAERRDPPLARRRAEVEVAADGMVATQEFRNIWRASVLELHRFAFDDRDTRLLLALRNLGGPLAKAADRVDPPLEVNIRPGFDARVGEFSKEADRALNGAREFSQHAGGLADITLLLGLASLALALYFPTDRLRALTRVGWLMTATGLIYLVAYYVVRTVIASELKNDISKDAVKGAWDGLIGGLRDLNLVLLIAGLLVVIGTAAVRRRLQHRDDSDRTARSVITSE
jgi:hypothetical protein